MKLELCGKGERPAVDRAHCAERSGLANLAEFLDEKDVSWCRRREPALTPSSLKFERTHVRCYKVHGGFTMIEIAIALAVIAFALVAVVGLLPLGMETQRDNREETIMMHDGTYLLEAIRSGARNAEELGRFVDQVNETNVTNPWSLDVIRGLSRVNQTNTAVVRTITGAAVFRSTNSDSRDFAMRYRVDCLITNASYAGYLSNHLYDVRLLLRWPLRRVNDAYVLVDEPRRQVFRTMVSGTVTNGFLDTSRFEAPKPEAP